MKIASIADVKAQLSAYVKASQEGPVVVTRNGKAVAVLLAVTEDDELERLLLAHSPKFQRSWKSLAVRSRRRAASRTNNSGRKWRPRAERLPASGSQQHAEPAAATDRERQRDGNGDRAEMVCQRTRQDNLSPIPFSKRFALFSESKQGRTFWFLAESSSNNWKLRPLALSIAFACRPTPIDCACGFSGPAVEFEPRQQKSLHLFAICAGPLSHTSGPVEASHQGAY